MLAFIIYEHKIQKIICTDDVVSMANTERKLQECIYKVLKEMEKIGQRNRQNGRSLARAKTKGKLRIGDAIAKRVEKCNYLGSVVADNVKSDAERRRCI